MSSLLEAALAYAEAGWWVFPVGAGEDRKQPLTSHGLKDATLDPEQIKAWWAKHPDANLGVATQPSGLAVVDVDDPLGRATLEMQHQELPPTLTVSTPRGGHHAIYAGEVKSTTSKLADGVDTRGRGGYIVVPPSSNSNGGYAWANQEAIRPLPQWVAELADPPRPDPVERELPEHPVEANDRWGKRVLDGEIARVATAREGTRNAVLFEAACNTFEAVKGGHLDEQHARQTLAAVAERAGLDGWEIDRTLGSAWDRTEERHPLQIEDTGPTLVDAPPLGAPTEDDTDQAFELLSVADLALIPAPTYLIPDRLPEGMTVLIGQPKTGKTFTAIDWACTVAATQGPVVYFIGEGVKGFAQRVRAWQAAFPQADLTNLHVVRKVPRMLDPDQVRMFYTTARRVLPRLVVIDTLSRATPGVNENDSENWTTIIDAFDQARDAYETSTLLVHHTNTQGQRPRGSNSLDGAVDALWRTDRDPESPDSFKLVCVHMKDDEEPHPVLGRIAPFGESALAFPSEFPRVTQGVAT